MLISLEERPTWVSIAFFVCSPIEVQPDILGISINVSIDLLGIELLFEPAYDSFDLATCGIKLAEVDFSISMAAGSVIAG